MKQSHPVHRQASGSVTPSAVFSAKADRGSSGSPPESAPRDSPFDSPAAAPDSGAVKAGPRVIGALLLVVGAGSGWWRFAKSMPAAEGAPAGGALGVESTASATWNPAEEANPDRRPLAKSSSRPAGPDSLARYFRADESARRTIIEEWADRAGEGGSPDEVAARLEDLHGKESDPALKEEILDALVWIASGPAFDSILRILRGAAGEDQRTAAATALASVISDRADAGDWERVARGMEADLPRFVRIAAVEAFMTEGDATAIPRLEELSGDPDPELREAAARAIEALAEPP